MLIFYHQILCFLIFNYEIYKGQDRSQTHLFPISLDQSIDSDNEVRLIDLFVDSLPLEDFGFAKKFVENGRPAYHPSDLLKLYIYGYLNKVRSSRDLEKESKRNIEVMWLLKALHPITTPPPISAGITPQSYQEGVL